MIVDCGGGTIDITTRKILSRKSLSEITESTGALCGSSYVDQEFIKYVCDSLEITEELEDIQARHSQNLRSFVQDAFIPLKSGFRDEKDKYRPFYLEIPGFLQDYVEPDKQDEMEEDDWVIELNFDDIKKMFDVAVDQIIQLINDQLNSSSSQCSAMFLVGGFSESSYLQSRIKSRFSTKVRTIAVPQNPITAVCRGATIYGNINHIVLFSL
jgi:actin-like ATPase involved in cell morphogenesis